MNSATLLIVPSDSPIPGGPEETEVVGIAAAVTATMFREDSKYLYYLCTHTNGEADDGSC